MTKLNPEFVKQIFSKIPELEQIIMKLKLLGKDKPIYSDWVILIIFIIKLKICLMKNPCYPSHNFSIIRTSVYQNNQSYPSDRNRLIIPKQFKLHYNLLK